MSRLEGHRRARPRVYLASATGLVAFRRRVGTAGTPGTAPLCEGLKGEPCVY
jgi:hypothetical protein